MATTTRAAVKVEHGQPLAVEEIILQDPKGPEVLVEYFATGICHSQLTQINHPAVRPPSLLGHEATGVVLKVGSEVTHIKEGDHCIVTWVPRDINVNSPALPPTTRWTVDQVTSSVAKSADQADAGSTLPVNHHWSPEQRSLYAATAVAFPAHTDPG